MQDHNQRHHPLLMAFNLSSMPVGDTFAQWGHKETKELISIRSQLDQNFLESKRSKFLWDVVSSQMKEKGYLRSAEQCKSKWKSLVGRYKKEEGMEHEFPGQFPFQEEMRSIFAARTEGLLWLEPGGSSSSTNKRKAISEEFFDKEEDDEDDEELSEEKMEKQHQQEHRKNKNKKKKNDRVSKIKEMLEEFIRQQQVMDARWKERMEAREKERRLNELEWRQIMESLEKERILMERSWREREEQRRVREEARSEKRHTLLTTLLTKLARDDN